MTKAGAIDNLFHRFDDMLRGQGYLAMGGQLLDATIVQSPRQRITKEEKAEIKAGKPADEIWDKPTKARQKDCDARWSIKYSKAKTTADGNKPLGHVDIAIPSFGYKNHISTDKKHGFIRKFDVTSAARYDGAVLPDLIAENTASNVWADSAYRSKKNEAWLAKNGKVSCIHRKKPKGKAMPIRTSKVNAKSRPCRACLRPSENPHGLRSRPYQNWYGELCL